MKAILIINLPINLNKVIQEIRVDVKAHLYGNEILDWRNQTIKPMPEKKDMLCGSSYDIIENRGYNICVDEILSETETWHSMQGNLEMPKGLFDKIYEDGEIE